MKQIQQIHFYPFQAFSWHLIVFIVGIAFASNFYYKTACKIEVLILIISSLLLLALVNRILKNNILSFLSWLIITLFCTLYFYANTYENYFPQLVIDKEPIIISGTIVRDPTLSYKNQELIVKTEYQNKSFLLLTKVPRNYQYRVGEKIELKGIIEKPGMIEDFNYQKYLMGKKVAYTMLNPNSSKPLAGQNIFIYRFLRTLYATKHYFEKSLNQIFHEPQASLAAGIITGAKRSMPQELTENFQKAGLSHIVALSGYNVSIIIIALSTLLAPLFNRKIVYVLSVFMTITFILMTGASSSVVRAGIFALMILTGKAMGKQAYLPNILLFTATVMLISNPFVLWYDIGFQLSFLAFTGIVYLSTPVEKFITLSKFKILPDFIKKMLCETVSAQLMVLPLLSYNFGSISLIAPISNIAVLWVIPLAMFLSFISALGSMIFINLGHLLAFIAWPTLWYIQFAAKIFSIIPYAAVNVGKNSYLFSLAFYFVLALWCFKYRLKHEK